jgi:hypothetical protein
MAQPHACESLANREDSLCEANDTHPEVTMNPKTSSGFRKRRGVSASCHLPAQGNEGRPANHGQRPQGHRLNERDCQQNRGKTKCMGTDPVQRLGEQYPLPSRTIRAVAQDIVDI